MVKSINPKEALDGRQLSAAIREQTLTPNQLLATADKYTRSGRGIYRSMSDLSSGVTLVGIELDNSQLGQLLTRAINLRGHPEVDPDSADALVFHIERVMETKGLEIAGISLRSKNI